MSCAFERGAAVAGVRGVPRLAEVREVRRGRGDRRDAARALLGAPRQDRAPCGRRRRCRATTSPTRPGGSAPRRRARARARRRRESRPVAHGRSSAPTSSATAEVEERRQELARLDLLGATTCGIAQHRDRRRVGARVGARRGRSWWCRDRCRRSSVVRSRARGHRLRAPRLRRARGSSDRGRRSLGHAERGRAPARMAQHALVRRLAAHVAGHAHRGGVEAALDRHRRAFGARQDRREVEALLQHGATAAVDRAHRRADLRVGVRRQVLLEKVDETAFLLQQREQAERGLAAIGRRCDGGGRLAGRPSPSAPRRRGRRRAPP